VYTLVGKTKGSFNRKINEDGNYFYLWELPNKDFLNKTNLVEVDKLFLFGSNQFWDGLNAETNEGSIMYLSLFFKSFTLLSNWQRQSDGTIVAHFDRGENFVILLKYNQKAYDVYWCIDPLNGWT